MIVRAKRNIKQNRNWFYFKFSVESLSFILQTSLAFAWLYQSVFLSKFVAFSPSDSEANRDGADAESPSPLFFSLFLLHLRTLAQEKRSQNCLRFGTDGPSLCLCSLLSRNIIFFPALTMAARAKKKIMAKRFAHAISVHYRDFEHAYVY